MRPDLASIFVALLRLPEEDRLIIFDRFCRNCATGIQDLNWMEQRYCNLCQPITAPIVREIQAEFIDEQSVSSPSAVEIAREVFQLLLSQGVSAKKEEPSVVVPKLPIEALRDRVERLMKA